MVTRAQSADRRTDGRRRASHSMDAVLTAAVALLDESGESALTFRALAARLGGGVGSIYWYVASREELLARATDHVLEDVLADTAALAASADPIEGLRAIAISFFDAIVCRPWLASYFMLNVDLQPNAMRLYERMGQQILRLGLDPRRSFHAVSAVTGFVVGIAADLGQDPPPEALAVGRDAFIGYYADLWRALDPAEYPFVHYIVDQFAGHDDRDQFLAGLDLLLDGLRLQAQAAHAKKPRR